MRTGNLGSALYAPGQVPSDPKALPAFLTAELAKLKAALDLVALGHVDSTTVAPAKPREGDIRLADGAAWSPDASGAANLYCYIGGTWKKLS